MDINLELPYITKNLPGIGGKIKQKPEDFIVEEIPLYKPCGSGEYLYMNITKKNLNTTDIQKKLAEIFKLKLSDISFAGIKDKVSISTQTFSIKTKLDKNFIKKASKEIQKNKNIKINWIKAHKNKLKPGHLLGNNFKIKITNLKIAKKQALERTEKIVSKLQEKGIPNFFGQQRFGINQNNIEKGFKIIKRKIKIRDKWLKRFLISSYQSYLCNLYLCKRIEKNYFNKVLKGDIVKKHETGGLFEIKNTESEQKRFNNKEISFTGPIYGHKMLETKDISGKFERQILEENKITLEDFKKSKIRGTRRIGRIFLKDLSIKTVNKEIIISFFLPKGSFATNVLREIMKSDSEKKGKSP